MRLLVQDLDMGRERAGMVVFICNPSVREVGTGVPG